MQSFASEVFTLDTPQIKITDIKSSKSCKELKFNINDGYLWGDICFYPKKNLLNSYREYRKENINNDDGKYLIKELKIGKNIKRRMKSVDLLLAYKWLNNNRLDIILHFGGGITTISFEEKKSGTTVKTIHNAD